MFEYISSNLLIICKFTRLTPYLLEMKLKLFFPAFLLLFALSSCSQMEYPSISDKADQTYAYGQVVWHDLITPNPDEAKKFYSELFGWTFQTLGDGDNAYDVIYNGDQVIGGLIRLDIAENPRGEWLSSVSVPDVDRAVAYNQQKGGKTMVKAQNFKGRGRSALVMDPQGAYISFVHSESGDPEQTAEVNSWLWNELWTNDLAKSVTFYKGIAPYDAEEVQDAKVPYYLLKQGNKKLTGIMKNPVEDMRSAWLPYIRVEDVNSVSEKAKEMGAVIMLEPSPEIRNNSVAIIQDPNGAPFAVQIWN